MNDPVAKKMLQRAEESPTAPPEDQTVKTLYIGNVDHKIKESDLRYASFLLNLKNIRDYFYYFGEIASINIVPNNHSAFIEFTTREAAESAIGKLYNNLIIHGTFLRLAWYVRSLGLLTPKG